MPANTSISLQNLSDFKDLMINNVINPELALKIDVAEKGVANGVATLDATGVIPNAQLPALAITEVFTVPAQADVVTLTAQRGDVAIALAENRTYILSTDDPTVLADWKEILAPIGGGGGVTSVNGQTGAVTIANATTTTAGLMSGADKTNLDTHRADASIHITPAEKTDIANHMADADIHVTTANKTNWNAKVDTITGGTVTAGATPGVTAVRVGNDYTIDVVVPVGGATVTVIDDLTSTSATSALSANQGRILDGRITTHINDTNPHVTGADKTNWNGKLDASDFYFATPIQIGNLF